MGDILIRPAHVDDAAPIARLFVTVRTECLPFLNWEYDVPFMATLFAGRIDEPGSFLVAEGDGGIAGFIRFDADEVHDLYVLPTVHGRGIGTALLDRAKAGTDGELRLWVFQENLAARAFYEARGFALELLTDGADNMEKCPDARYLWRRGGL